MKKDSFGSGEFVFKNGKMERAKETSKDNPIPKKSEDIIKETERLIAAQAPFREITEDIIAAISKSLDKNEGKMKSEDMLRLPVGALAYVLAHYYVYLNKVATLSGSREDFLNEFSAHVVKSLELFHDVMDPKKKKKKGEDKEG